jgi:hypothetical protein
VAVKQLAALLAAAVAAVAIAAAAFGIVSVLPEPTRGDSLAVRLLGVLRERRGSGSVISIGNARLRAQCFRIRSREHVTLDDGTSFVLNGSHVLARREPTSRLAAVSVRHGPIASAEADLSGSYALYSAEVIGQLERGARITARRARFGGEAAFLIALRDRPPHVDLLVSERSLQPLAVHFWSARLDARGVIISTRRGRRGC